MPLQFCIVGCFPAPVRVVVRNLRATGGAETKGFYLVDDSNWIGCTGIPDFDCAAMKFESRGSAAIVAIAEFVQLERC
jgi:hypothetical protein